MWSKLSVINSFAQDTDSAYFNSSKIIETKRVKLKMNTQVVKAVTTKDVSARVLNSMCVYFPADQTLNIVITIYEML